MNNLIKIVLAVLGGLYVISPYDPVPDFLPVLGRLDDLVVVVLLFYWLWRGRLPRFLSGWFGGKEGARKQTEAGPEKAEEAKQATFDPYEVLGVPRDAGQDQIREAYHRASQQYHPDKVAHLGEELQELAARKFLDIQKAWETLRR